MDKVWKQLPYDCLERIAHFADIDTRRAMGFPPRRLVVPPLKLRIPCVREVSNAEYGPPKPLTQQNLKITDKYKYMFVVDFGNVLLYIHSSSMSWYFRKSHYNFCFNDKSLTTIHPDTYERVLHPDFNEDGSFKRTCFC